MFFRFSGLTPGGDLRSGVVQAETEAAARAQLEKRGFQSLQLTPAEAPLPQGGAPPPSPAPTRAPKLTPSTPPPPPPPEPGWWSRVDWVRLAPLLAVLVVLVGAIWAVVHYLSRDRLYTISVEGDVHLKTQRRLSEEYWNRVRLYLWLPDQKIAVHSDGSTWQREGPDKWTRRRDGAAYQCKISVEGHYQLEVEVALPKLPDRVGIIAHAPGFKPKARQNVSLKPAANKLVGQCPSMLLNPREKKAEEAGKTVSGKRRRRHRPRRRPGATSPSPAS